jgi:L-cysteine/cystine lyase
MERSMIIRGGSLVSAGLMHEFRAEFPVLDRVAYLNAGTNGPVPERARAAAERSIRRQTEEGRAGKALFEELMARIEELRRRAAALLGADAAEVALTGSTTGGVNAALAALELSADDEILTSDEEHPGVLGPLAAARAAHGLSVRVVAFDALAEAVRPSTRLVVTSHVSWRTGRVVDAAGLAATDAQVLLDGAQGLGAVPVDVRALGCDFYAASGQKWLCGPVGSGYLYVSEERIGELMPANPGYGTVEDPLRALDFELCEGAARFDGGLPPSHHSAWALAAIDNLESAGIDTVLTRGPALAARLAEMLTSGGLSVAPRCRSTLVSWEAPDPEAESMRLLERGFVLRHLPGTPYVRASVGAWSEEEELERLVAAATSGS